MLYMIGAQEHWPPPKMMASFSLSAVPTTTINKTKTNAHRFKTRENQNHRFKTSCDATPNDDDKTLQKSLEKKNLDRRNLLLGLGSLVGAASLTSLPSAFAVPTATPPKGPVVHVRPAEQRASSKYIKKYETAIQDMKKSEESIDTNKLKYKSERSEIPWAKSRPTTNATGSMIEDKSVGLVKKVEDIEFPMKLDKTVKVRVKRPAINRTKEDKAKATEILIVNGVNFDGEKYVKFDVLVNDNDDETKITASDSEFAGSFAQLPHGKTEKMMMTSGARFGLTGLLEDLKAEDDEYVMVTFVPRKGCEDVTVSEIKIELVPSV